MSPTSEVLTASVPSYAPVTVECPEQPLLRLAGSAIGRNQTLSQAEANFRKGRRSEDWPVLGIAHSGGAMRGRLPAQSEAFIPLATYVTGLSGGSWLVASAAANNYPPVPEMVSGWDLEKDMVLPGGIKRIEKHAVPGRDPRHSQWGRALSYHFLPGTTNESKLRDYSPVDQVDVMIDSSHASRSTLLESAHRLLHQFTYDSPRRRAPVLGFEKHEKNARVPDTTSNRCQQSQAFGRIGHHPSNVPVSGETYVPLSAPVYEVSPFEFGSYDPQLSAFIPTEFIGTSLNAGKPYVASPKARKIDLKNICLFNAITGVPVQYTSVMSMMARKLSGVSLDKSLTARWPNPFMGVSGPSGFDRSRSNELLIVDGGENGENIPLNPLLTPARQIDVILAADASKDSNSTYADISAFVHHLLKKKLIYRFRKTSGVNGEGWPNGSSMINTFLRVTRVLPAGTANFPPVPLDTKIWEQRGEII
ncbi:hypothetical protein KEM48_005801 [Puccinia striiformis f. sp. tritici PST-130]|nr:hypothetical protein KEM48_005801 [Puccinia striiformis f. sp. tritici PST-130]